MKLCDFGCGKPAIKTFKSGRSCCSNATASCPGQKAKNNSDRRVNIDWAEVQRDYDVNFLSQRDIQKKYGISGGPFQTAMKHGWFVSRTPSDALTIATKQGKCGTNSWTDEQKKEHSERSSLQAYARHAAGWDNKAGRCKKYRYTSPVAGEVTLDGTWELAVAEWLDMNGFYWRRNKTRFKYTHPSGASRHYTPDFWAEGFGYIEVKGYETKLDRCKWSQFPEPITVWRKDTIHQIRKELEENFSHSLN